MLKEILLLGAVVGLQMKANDLTVYNLSSDTFNGSSFESVYFECPSRGFNADVYVANERTEDFWDIYQQKDILLGRFRWNGFYGSVNWRDIYVSFCYDPNFYVIGGSYIEYEMADTQILFTSCESNKPCPSYDSSTGYVDRHVVDIGDITFTSAFSSVVDVFGNAPIPYFDYGEYLLDINYGTSWTDYFVYEYVSNDLGLTMYGFAKQTPKSVFGVPLDNNIFVSQVYCAYEQLADGNYSLFKFIRPIDFNGSSYEYGYLYMYDGGSPAWRSISLYLAHSLTDTGVYHSHIYQNQRPAFFDLPAPAEVVGYRLNNGFPLISNADNGFYENIFEQGEKTGYERGFGEGYGQGYNVGLQGYAEYGTAFNFLTGAVNSFAGLFAVAIFPGITLGTLVFIPLVIGLILLIVKMAKG